MDLQSLMNAVDRLPPDEFDELLRHMKERRTMKIGIVPPENLKKLKEVTEVLQQDAEQYTEEEINSFIDEAIAEVRRERKAKNSG